VEQVTEPHATVPENPASSTEIPPSTSIPPSSGTTHGGGGGHTQPSGVHIAVVVPVHHGQLSG
jgi:hypothetical protein